MYIISTQAQIRVDQFGDVNIGVTTTNSIDNLGDLIIGQDGLDNSLSFYNSTGTSLRMYRMNDYGFIMRGRNIEGQTYNYKGIIIDANGNIGIKALPNSSYSLYVSGPAYSTGSWQGSDIRMKSNVKKISVQSHVYDSLTPISYNYKLKKVNKSGTDMGGYAQADADSIDTNISFGFSAQEVQKYFPNLVQEDGQGFLAVNYDGFIPILWQANQIQTQRIVFLEQKVLQLEKGINANQINSNFKTSITTNTSSNIELYASKNKDKSIVNVYVMDLTGSLLQVHSQDVNGNITVPAGSYKAGMYIISYIVNGKLENSTTLMITK